MRQPYHYLGMRSLYTEVPYLEGFQAALIIVFVFLHNFYGWIVVVLDAAADHCDGMNKNSAIKQTSLYLKVDII